jgi:hypothetical protein
MKLVTLFDDFLKDVVNLNQGRIDRLGVHVGAVDTFVRNNYGATVRKCEPQGSWAHKTIIKPATDDHEFDADLVVFVNPVPGWQPRDYVNNLHSVFAASDRYKDILLEPNTRCTTLDYSGDFHLDVVPCLYASVGGVTGYWVCNGTANRYEQTAPDEYTAWIRERNAVTGGNLLRKTVRLLKYLRDFHGTVHIKSILLTTLIGNMAWGNNGTDDPYSDLPTAFRTLVGRLDNFLQANPVMPVIQNPVLSCETFTRHWDQGKYAEFRNSIRWLRERIDDAYVEADRDESIRKWRGIFGPDFARGLAVIPVERLSGAALVNQAARLGTGFVASAYNLFSPPHAKRPKWEKAKQSIKVSVEASEHTSKRGPIVKKMRSGDVVRNGNVLRFEARVPSGLPQGFEVEWQVTNTGFEARQQLRGDFYRSIDGASRWEPTAYPGIHWVKAFVVNKRTNQYCGQSDPFLVAID